MASTKTHPASPVRADFGSTWSNTRFSTKLGHGLSEHLHIFILINVSIFLTIYIYINSFIERIGPLFHRGVCKGQQSSISISMKSSKYVQIKILNDSDTDSNLRFKMWYSMVFGFVSFSHWCHPWLGLESVWASMPY